MFQEIPTCAALSRRTPCNNSDATIQDTCTSHAGHSAPNDEIVRTCSIAAEERAKLEEDEE